jgi:carbon-monoxide dehydrogenase medium subunit
MYPPEFDYARPDSVAEAVSLLQSHDDAKLLAGGHSLLPVMKLRLSHPSTLIDIGRIDALRGISEIDGGFRIGATTTHAMIAAHEDLPTVLTEAAGMIGDPQVRNRGTIGGNVAHADPASDYPTVLTALDATLHLTGPNGSRTLRAGNFFTGLFATALGEHELVTAIDVREEGLRTGSGYAKLYNPASRYAMVGAAATVTLDLTGKCTAAGVAVGGLTPQATWASSAVNALVGKRLDHEALDAAAAAVDADLGSDILGDIHASAAYRRAMAPVFVRRALGKAVERAGWAAKVTEWIADLTH